MHRSQHEQREMVAPSVSAPASLLLILSTQLWVSGAAFAFVNPRGVSRPRSCRAPQAGYGTSTTAIASDSPAARNRRFHSIPSHDAGSEGEESGGYGCSRGGRYTALRRKVRRRNRCRHRHRLRAKEEAEMESEVLDAEFSDAISKIERADVESKGKKRREEPGEQGQGSPRMSVAKKAPRAPAPAPAPFSFSASGFASLEDAAASGEFVDLSGGRHSCLKRVDEAGLEKEGNPPQGSKVKVHYKMKVVGGDNIASSGEDRSKPFEFRLGRWPSEATHGWDKAVSAMHRGEVATLICGPQYAFGEAGAPPKIPPDATVETQLELVDWLDLAATYNAVPGKVETDEELRDRWSEDLAAGTSPMKDEAGLKKRMQAEMATKAAAAPPNTDHRGKKIYDLKSKEARDIMAKQKVQGYTPDFGYVERVGYLDLYIPVPEGTRAKDVTVEIHPDRMLVALEGAGVVTKGHFHGKVALDGCYWLMSDLSLDPPGTQDDEVRQGPVYRGETCVQVFLEKMKPFDTLWENVYRPPEDDGAS